MIRTTQSNFSLLTWAQLLLILFVTCVNLRAAAQSAVQPVPSFASHQNWDPSIAAMVGALFCAFLFMGFFSVYVRHCSDSYINTGQNQIGDASRDWPCSCSQGIDPQVLDSFPILVYSTINDLKIRKGALECAVCLSEFKENETLRLLPKCNHVFHPCCIDAWLSSHVTCPVCREKLNPNFAEAAMTVPIQLTANEMNEESSIPRDEHGDTEENQNPNVNEGDQRSTNYRENVRVTVDEARGKQNTALKSGRFGELTRSNSTGHCEVEGGGKNERYTLRLPEDVRRYILLNQGTITMRRSASYNVIMPLSGSSRKGLCGNEREGMTRDNKNAELWVVSRTPPFVSRHAYGKFVCNWKEQQNYYA